jgi:hypothetical protein
MGTGLALGAQEELWFLNKCYVIEVIISELADVIDLASTNSLKHIMLLQKLFCI